MKGRDCAENLLKEIAKLDPIEFLGVCKILSIPVYEEDTVEATAEGARASDSIMEDGTPRDFQSIWEDVCDKVWYLNRTRRRTLGKLLRAVNKED